MYYVCIMDYRGKKVRFTSYSFHNIHVPYLNYHLACSSLIAVFKFVCRTMLMEQKINLLVDSEIFRILLILGEY